jgi:hypothetical protein
MMMMMMMMITNETEKSDVDTLVRMIAPVVGIGFFTAATYSQLYKPFYIFSLYMSRCPPSVSFIANQVITIIVIKHMYVIVPILVVDFRRRYSFESYRYRKYRFAPRSAVRSVRSYSITTGSKCVFCAIS